jgi:hypothetical protein
MSFVILLFTVLVTQVSSASESVVSPKCRNYVEHNYLTKGRLDSKRASSRVWSFTKLSNKLKTNSANECDREAFQQAHQESQEVLSNLTAPQEEAKVCEASEPQLRAFSVDNIKAVAKLLKQRIQDKVPGSTHALLCADNLKEGILASLDKLGEGMKSVTLGSVDLATRYGPAMWVYMKAAVHGTLPQYYSEINRMGSNISEEVEKTIREMLEVAAAKVDRVQRFNNEFERTAFICDTVGSVGVDVYLGSMLKNKFKSKKEVPGHEPNFEELYSRGPKFEEPPRASGKRKPSGESKVHKKSKTKEQLEVEELIKKVPDAKLPSSVLENVEISRLSLEDSVAYMSQITGSSDWKKGYKALISKIHPDKFSSAPPKVQKIITTESTRLNELKEHIESFKKGNRSP